MILRLLFGKNVTVFFLDHIKRPPTNRYIIKYEIYNKGKHGTRSKLPKKSDKIENTRTTIINIVERMRASQNGNNANELWN